MIAFNRRWVLFIAAFLVITVVVAGVVFLRPDVLPMPLKKAVADQSEKAAVTEWLKNNLNDPDFEVMKFWPAVELTQRKANSLADLHRRIGEIEAGIRSTHGSEDYWKTVVAELKEEILTTEAAPARRICRIKYRIKSPLGNSRLLVDEVFYIESDGKVRRYEDAPSSWAEYFQD